MPAAAGGHGHGRLRDDARNRGTEAGGIQAHPGGAQAPPAGQEAPKDARPREQEAMTVSSQQPTTLTGRPQYEPCEECGAPLDPQQRYCVNCAARRGNGANPFSRYFATMSKRARRPSVRPSAVKTSSGSRAAEVAFFALLPIAVAIGVVVGRSGNDSGENEALLEALHRQEVAQASTPTAGVATTAGSAKKAKAKKANGSSKGS